LSGCGSSSGTSSSQAPASSPSSSDVTSTSGGHTVAVTLADFSITLAGGTSLKPGDYTFQVPNNGPSSHNLTIDGPGVADKATPTFAPGETKTLSVTLQKGTYEFFCSVPGHKQAGMDDKVNVGGASAAGGSSGGSSSSSGGGWS